jgi:DNA-binding beta-propeller fold protein YncE
VSHEPSTTPAETPRAPALRRGLDGRRLYLLAAAILLVILIALVGFLVWLLRPVDITQRGGEVRAGIEPVFALYGPGSGKKPYFDKPMAAAWGPNKRIYVADSKNNRIVVFSAQGRYLSQFGEFGIAKPPVGSAITWVPGQLNYPTGVATDDEGNIYVADFKNDSISVFNDAGTFLRRFPDPYRPTGRGSSGAGNSGIAVGALAVADGKVYAADSYQILVFDTQGVLLKQFGRPGQGPEGLDHPNGIAVDSKGRIYVSDSNQNRVTAFTPDGAFMWSTGKPITSLTESSSNPFVLPRGIAVLADSSILVADPLAHQLVKLTSAGKFVVSYGDRGQEPGQVNFPTGLATADDLVLIADKENNRVQAIKLVGP